MLLIFNYTQDDQLKYFKRCARVNLLTLDQAPIDLVGKFRWTSLMDGNSAKLALMVSFSVPEPNSFSNLLLSLPQATGAMTTN